jgi:hypothetical protein
MPSRESNASLAAERDRRFLFQRGRLKDQEEWKKRVAAFRAPRENPGATEVRAREKEKTTFNRNMALQRNNNRFQMDKEALTGKNRIAEVRQQGKNLFATTDRQEFGATARKRIEQARLGVSDRLKAFNTLGALSKTKNDMGVETLDTTRLGELSGLINSFAGGPGVEPIRQNAGILDAKPTAMGMAGSALSPLGGVSLSAKQPAQQDFIRQPRQSGGSGNTPPTINGIPENEFMIGLEKRFAGSPNDSKYGFQARNQSALDYLRGGYVEDLKKPPAPLMEKKKGVPAEASRFDKPVLPPDDKKGGRVKGKQTQGDPGKTSTTPKNSGRLGADQKLLENSQPINIKEVRKAINGMGNKSAKNDDRSPNRFPSEKKTNPMKEKTPTDRTERVATNADWNNFVEKKKRNENPFYEKGKDLSALKETRKIAEKERVAMEKELRDKNPFFEKQKDLSAYSTAQRKKVYDQQFEGTMSFLKKKYPSMKDALLAEIAMEIMTL